MRKAIITSVFIIIMFLILTDVPNAQIADPPNTFCNPLNLSYRFSYSAKDTREAADPVIVLFKDNYVLFASRCGGYWTSPDLMDWTLIIPTGLPLEDYAPGAFAIGDTLYFTAFNTKRIFSCTDPKAGEWQKAANLQRQYPDPDLFLDDDGKVYMYYGCSNSAPLYAVELDPQNAFSEIGEPVEVIPINAAEHGWERRGDNNFMDESPWLEGCWMTKYNNKYYLQYAGPGTEFKTYADGVYTSDKPLGPFKYEPYSPVSFKPTGFITGAGHGCTFQDKSGNYWRIITEVISVNHMFERRLGLYPAAFDGDGVMRTNTVFADYPQFLPGVKENPVEENFPGWMLLSLKKNACSSSYIEGHEIYNAVDEDVKTFWSAKSGNPGEWMMLDLGKSCQVHALQINFAENGTDYKLVKGREISVYEQYVVEISSDSVEWTTLIDKSANDKDVPHDYIELALPVQARYIKLTNRFTPGTGLFAVRDLRIFGNPLEASFTQVKNLTIVRGPDERDALVRWTPVENYDGYIIRYGIHPDKLYNHYMVYDADSLFIHSLNKGVEYYFSVEAFDGGTDFYEGEYIMGIKKENDIIPETFGLGQNYPNPFNPSTQISFSLPYVSRTSLDIYNIRGERVETLVNKTMQAGYFAVLWDGKDKSGNPAPSGLYFYRLVTENSDLTRRMVLLK